MKTRMEILMEERGIQIEEIASATQLAYRTVWSAKKGHPVTRSTKSSIAKYFGLPMVEVFPAGIDHESNRHQNESSGGAA